MMTKYTMIATAAAGTLVCQAASGAEKDSRPNIVFILADDLGWSDLPAYGNRFNETPNLNRLVREGMRFTDAYAACPVCSPTRASLMSGQYPARVGVTDFIPGHWRPFEQVTVPVNRTQYLPEKIVTVAEALKGAGYATAMFGKWHLGDAKASHPLNQGFDEANVGQGFFDVRFDPPREDSKEKIMADRLADFGIDFMERHKSGPFLLFLSHWDVHCRYDAEDAMIEKFIKKEPVPGYPCNPVYAAMIGHLDRSVGRVLDKLDELGLRENTLVVFYSDNGGSISENPYPGVEEDGRPGGRMNMVMPSKHKYIAGSPLQYISTSNLPLRGEKGTVYEGGIREPLIACWPAKIRPGSVCHAPVTTPDFYPTFLELARAAKPTDQVLDGVSLVPVLLKNEYASERAIFWHYPVYHHDVPAAAVRKGDWKLVKNLVDQSVALFNLRIDAGEQTDLAATFPSQRDELNSLLTQWRKDVGAEMPQPNPAFDPARRHEWGKHPDSK